MLYKRVLTAAVLIPLVLWSIFYLPKMYFEGVLAIILLACAYEWTALLKIAFLLERFLFLVAVLAGFYAVKWLPMAYFLDFVFVVLCILVFCVHRFQQQRPVLPFNCWWLYGIGFILFVSTWLSINIVHFILGGPPMLLGLLLVVWLSDTAAYFVGRRWGTTKLADQVSPSKTWAGFWGAGIAIMLLTLVQAACFKYYFYQFAGYLIVNGITFIAAVYGDLFESMIKRLANCKDSGDLLPGHGGMLDRLDSLLFAAPCYTLGLLLLKINWAHSF